MLQKLSWKAKIVNLFLRHKKVIFNNNLQKIKKKVFFISKPFPPLRIDD